MSVAKARAGAVLEGPELLTKPGVSVALGMGRPVFLPQQHQGDALALQFGGNLGPVRLLKILRRAANTLEQSRLQRRVIVAPRRQRPAIKPGFARTQKVGRHRRLAQLQTQPDLPHREALLMGQP